MFEVPIEFMPEDPRMIPPQQIPPQRNMFGLKPIDGGTMVTFTIPGGVITPPELPKVVEEFELLIQSHLAGGIVISGRGPVWLYVALAHAAHPAKWVGTYEPRSGGAIVCSSHTSEPILGSFVSC